MMMKGARDRVVRDRAQTLACASMGSTQFPASYGQTAANATADPSAVSRLTTRALIESCLEMGSSCKSRAAALVRRPAQPGQRRARARVGHDARCIEPRTRCPVRGTHWQFRGGGRYARNRRGIPDVACNADPGTGILIYAGFLPGAGNNAFNGVPGYSAATGWDLASGWGTPNLGKLVGELAKQEVDSNQRTGFFVTRAGTARAGQPGSGLTICAGPGRINSPLRCRPAATAGRRLRCCGCSRQSRSPADERSAASPHAASR